MILFNVTSAWEQVLQESGPANASPVRAPRYQLPGAVAHGLEQALAAARWLQRSGLRAVVPTRPRRLRVRETVSLGDKRLVAIVAVDGVEYLIGGGTTNVCLLTQLAPRTATNSTFQDALANAGGDSGTA